MFLKRIRKHVKYNNFEERVLSYAFKDIFYMRRMTKDDAVATPQKLFRYDNTSFFFTMFERLLFEY